MGCIGAGGADARGTRVEKEQRCENVESFHFCVL